MDPLPRKFPHLDLFLSAYLHQDWGISGDTLESVLMSYALDTSPTDVVQLKTEIDQLIKEEGDRINTDYYTL